MTRDAFGNPVILAPHRAERPDVIGSDAHVCPFCRGREAMTPPSIVEVGRPWRLRVFANKYPASEQHEVIVEAPDDATTFDLLPPDDAAAAVQLYADRYAALASIDDVQYVSVFKNHGARAGASIAHIHSQVIGIPFVPPRVEREAAVFASGCPICSDDAGIVIAQTEAFRWVVPSVAPFAYQQWIVPKRHAAEMTSGVVAGELASLLQASARAMARLGDGAFNWMFMNFPNAPQGHWYVDIVPRTAAMAGFELSTGTMINTIDPAAAARWLADGAARHPSTR